MYKAEDLPHKKKESGGTRASFRKDKKEIKCDSYCKFVFAGKKGNAFVF